MSPEGMSPNAQGVVEQYLREEREKRDQEARLKAARDHAAFERFCGRVPALGRLV